MSIFTLFGRVGSSVEAFFVARKRVPVHPIVKYKTALFYHFLTIFLPFKALFIDFLDIKTDFEDLLSDPLGTPQAPPPQNSPF